MLSAETSAAPEPQLLLGVLEQQRRDIGVAGDDGAQQRRQDALLHLARALVDELEQGLEDGGGHLGEGGRVGVAPLGLEEPLEVRRARREHQLLIQDVALALTFIFRWRWRFVR